MIYQERWYKEALFGEELRRVRELLRKNPDQAREYFIEEAIKSWRVGQTSELEKQALKDSELWDLLTLTAQRAGYLPYLTMPEVFYTSRGLTEEQRGEIFALAFSKIREDRQIRDWLFEHVAKGMVFEEVDADILADMAIQHAEDGPSLLITIIQYGNAYNTVLGAMSDTFLESLYKAAVKVAEATKHPEVLKWVWDSDVYEYNNDEGKPPDLSWEAVYATSEDSLPGIEYQVTHCTISSGDGHRFDDVVEQNTVSLAEFGKNFPGSTLRWSRGPASIDPWALVSGEVSEDDSYSEQTVVTFGGTHHTIVTWLMDHWPPPDNEAGV